MHQNLAVEENALFRFFKFIQPIKNRIDLFISFQLFHLNAVYPLENRGVIHPEVPHCHKCVNNSDTCIYGGITFQYGRKHGYSLFGKCKMINGRMFEPPEPVAICDQFIFLLI